jgi:activator of HSP90 ATPase
LKKGEKIVQEWTMSQWQGVSALDLQLDLKEVEGGTELTMIHSKVPDGQADDYAEGWKEYYWNPMVEYFQKAVKEPS